VVADEPITNVSFSISVIGNSKFINFSLAKGWTNLGLTSNVVLSGAGKTGEFNVGSINFKVGSSTSQVSTILVKNVKLNTTSVTNAQADIPIESSQNRLSSLAINGYTLSPAFDPEINSYQAKGDASSATITATVQDSSATISGTGTVDVAFGENAAKFITVTSQSGQARTYQIVMTRSDSRSSNNSLKSISLSSGSISLKDSVTYYTTTVDQSVTSITVKAELSDTKSHFVDGFGSPQTISDLKLGNNSVLIKVVAENEQQKTYTININRNDGRSDDNYLGSLQVSPGKIDFNKDIQGYYVKTLFSTTELEVTAIADNNKATVNQNGGNNLIVGENVITISVTAENGAVREYTIHVNRLAEGVKFSNNNYLSGLSLNGKVIKLSKNVFDYSVDIDGSDPIEVSATTSDPLAIATVSGIDEFNTSKQITISVMAEDGSVRVYKIINKNKPSLVPVIVASAVSFLSIISAVILIIKHRKKATDIAMPAINSTNDIVGQDTKPDQQPANDSVDITRI